jgi:hypothetical protein
MALYDTKNDWYYYTNLIFKVDKNSQDVSYITSLQNINNLM